MRKNRLKLGLGVLTVLATPIAVNTVASNDALAAQGWVKSGNTWYFYNKNGTLARNAWAGNYWLGADGKMVTNAWVDNGRYYVGSNGEWVKNAQKPAAATTNTAKQGWVQSGASWYYLDANGRVVRNAWIGNYWLGTDGRMATSSWVDNGRYYVGSNGLWVQGAKKQEEKKQGWVKSGSDWYYYENGTLVRNKWAGNYWLGTDGKMATSSWVDNGRYYVGSNGLWDKNAKKQEEKKQGWVKSGSDWYYFDQNGTLARNKWAGNYWLGADGKMVISSWVDNGRYYVGSNGLWDKNAKKQEVPKPAEKKQGWVKSGSDWYYFDQNGTLVRNKWAGNYWLGADGKMATNSWVDNGRYYVGSNGLWDKNAKKQEESKSTGNKKGWVKSGSDWYYYDDNGTLARNKWAGNYWLGTDGKMVTNSWVDNGRYYVGSNGAWVKNAGQGVTYSAYYKVTALYIPVYDANGRILSHVSRDTVLFRDGRAESNGRIPVQVAGLTGYVNASQVTAVDSSSSFIPDYVSDGKYVYHRYSPSTKVMVAYHNANMQVGKSYYSADGINFGTFKLDHPFQFANLNSKTNYTAADINRLYSLMGANDSKLAGKGATFKAAEQKYGVNALYLVAHSALESAWGRSNIAKDKNNFFGIAAYDDTPYTSATKYDSVDGGIMGAARWIKERYLHNSGYPANGAYLGNKAGGMNVNYATAPYWGESIASIMFNANEKLGRKDG